VFMIPIFMTFEEEKGGKSQDSDMGSDPGNLCIQNFYPYHIILKQ